MKFRSRILLVAILIAFVTEIHAQPQNYNIRNGIGIQAGVSLFDIDTDNFITKQGTGFVGGMAATVDLPHKWYTISWGMLLSEQNFEISGRPSSLTAEEMIEYKLKMVQLNFLFHAKVLGDAFTIDVGPQIQYNGELELKNSNHETYQINNYSGLSAQDITDISKINANAVAGISAGFGPIRLRAHYIYGITNMLNKLNNNSLEFTGENSEFKGNQNIITLTALITL